MCSCFMQDLSDFQTKVWERKPKLYTVSNNKRSFLTSLGGKDVLRQAIEEHIKGESGPL